MKKIKAKAIAMKTPWELDDGWLAIDVVRVVADEMLELFVWHWCRQVSHDELYPYGLHDPVQALYVPIGDGAQWSFP